MHAKARTSQDEQRNGLGYPVLLIGLLVIRVPGDIPPMPLEAAARYPYPAEAGIADIRASGRVDLTELL